MTDIFDSNDVNLLKIQPWQRFKTKLGLMLLASATKSSLTEANEKSWGQGLATQVIDRKIDKAEFDSILAAVFANHSKETVDLMNSLTSKIGAVSELITAVNSLAGKMDGLKAALLAGFAKADADAGVSDTNYRDTVAALLS